MLQASKCCRHHHNLGNQKGFTKNILNDLNRETFKNRYKNNRNKTKVTIFNTSAQNNHINIEGETLEDCEL